LTAGDPAARSALETERVRDQRGGKWRIIRSIHRRRPLLTAVLVLAAPAHSLLTDTFAFDLLGSDRSWRFFVPWLLVLFGVAVRLWGSGNLRKNREITDSGVYRLVRHPLYLGSLAFFLAYFLTAVDPRVGFLLFAVLVAFVYYPTMLSEEEFLALRFPELSTYDRPPRLIPDLRRFPEALRTDRFDARAAYRNLGFRSAWFVLVLPLFLRILRWIQSSIA
jgi:protein-S-isoprenylcysteine O-methyltransferase Ste14